MQELFCRVLEISFTGCFCICIVLPIRLLLLKYGRKYAYYLWLAVFLNLVIPFSIQGTFSLIPRQAVDFSVDVEAQTGKLLFTRPSKSGKKTDIANSVPLGNNPQAETVQQNKGRLYPTSIQQAAHSQPNKNNRPLFSIDTLQTIWIVGLIGIMVYNIIHMILFKRLISLDKWVHWNESERIAEVCGLPAPFLWGMIHPIIFLPSTLAEEEKIYITMHEKYHRKRGDAYLKLAAYAVAALHWFNPAVWAAWILFCRDMEISCDEAVLENTKKDIRCQYAQSLLQYAAGRNGYVVTPPTFGEPSAKTRIQSILRFQKKKPLYQWTAGIVTLIILFGLLIHPASIWEFADLSEYTSHISNNANKGMLQAYNTIEDIKNQITDSKKLGDAIPSTPLYPNKDSDSGTWHREGYTPTAITHIHYSFYFTPDLRSEEELDALAQRALQELYDLTGFQTDSCVYSCSDMGAFFFANNESDLKHSRTFYSRDYGENEGYDAMIPCIDIANARRVWYSNVQQFDIPEHIDDMTQNELALWFLQRSSIYQGENITAITYLPDLDAVKLITADGSFYEVILDIPIQAVSSIYGPYPKGASH